MVTDNLLLHFPDMLIHTVGITPSLLNAVSSKLSYVASMMTDSLPEVNRARVHYLELCNSQAFHLLWLVDVLYNLLNLVASTILVIAALACGPHLVARFGLPGPIFAFTKFSS